MTKTTATYSGRLTLPPAGQPDTRHADSCRVRARRDAGVQRGTCTCKPWRGHVDRIDFPDDGWPQTSAARRSMRPLPVTQRRISRARTNTRDAAQTFARTPRAEDRETPAVRTAAGANSRRSWTNTAPGSNPRPTVGPGHDRACERKRDLMVRSVQPKRTGQRGRSCRPTSSPAPVDARTSPRTTSRPCGHRL